MTERDQLCLAMDMFQMFMCETAKECTAKGIKIPGNLDRLCARAGIISASTFREMYENRDAA